MGYFFDGDSHKGHSWNSNNFTSSPNGHFKSKLMGIIRSCFSFIAGTAFGVYVAQNYQVPNIAKLADTAIFMAKIIEEKYRKPKKRGGDDDFD